MGVNQSQASALAPRIDLTVLHNAAGGRLVTRLVSVTRAELPPARDGVRETQHYLG